MTKLLEALKLYSGREINSYLEIEKIIKEHIPEGYVLFNLDDYVRELTDKEFEKQTITTSPHELYVHVKEDCHGAKEWTEFTPRASDWFDDIENEIRNNLDEFIHPEWKEE